MEFRRVLFRSLVISAIGANKDSLFFYRRVKGLMEEDIRTIPCETISVFRPSLIDGERKEVRVMEKLSLKIERSLGRIMKRSEKSRVGKQSDRTLRTRRSHIKEKTQKNT